VEVMAFGSSRCCRMLRSVDFVFRRGVLVLVAVARRRPPNGVRLQSDFLCDIFVTLAVFSHELSQGSD